MIAGSIDIQSGWESSKRNSKLNSRVDIWNEQIDLGEVFDSSGGFTLPNGAVRSPDVTWIEKSKLEGISPDIAFPEVVPDFVIELRSKTDRLHTNVASFVDAIQSRFYKSILNKTSSSR